MNLEPIDEYDWFGQPQKLFTFRHEGRLFLAYFAEEADISLRTGKPQVKTYVVRGLLDGEEVQECIFVDEFFRGGPLYIVEHNVARDLVYWRSVSWNEIPMEYQPLLHPRGRL
jgi:hypothetical protein